MRSTILCAALVSLAVSPAFACGGGKTLFSDSFDSMKSVWGKPTDHIWVSQGRMVLAESDGQSYTNYADPTFDDIDVCVKIRLNKASDQDSVYGGVAFWMKDLDNFYAFQIIPGGSAAVYRMVGGDWKTVIKDRPSDSILQGTAHANELEIVTHGPSASLYINGDHFSDILGGVPNGGQHVGFSFQAPEDGNVEFVVDDLRVNQAD